MVLEAPVLTAEFLTTTPVPAQGCPQLGDIQKTDPGTVHILAPCIPCKPGLGPSSCHKPATGPSCTLSTIGRFIFSFTTVAWVAQCQGSREACVPAWDLGNVKTGAGCCAVWPPVAREGARGAMSWLSSTGVES